MDIFFLPCLDVQPVSSTFSNYADRVGVWCREDCINEIVRPPYICKVSEPPRSGDRFDSQKWSIYPVKYSARPVAGEAWYLASATRQLLVQVNCVVSGEVRKLVHDRVSMRSGTFRRLYGF